MYGLLYTVEYWKYRISGFNVNNGGVLQGLGPGLALAELGQDAFNVHPKLLGLQEDARLLRRPTLHKVPLKEVTLALVARLPETMRLSFNLSAHDITSAPTMNQNMSGWSIISIGPGFSP